MSGFRIFASVATLGTHSSSLYENYGYHGPRHTNQRYAFALKVIGLTTVAVTAYMTAHAIIPFVLGKASLSLASTVLKIVILTIGHDSAIIADNFMQMSTGFFSRADTHPDTRNRLHVDKDLKWLLEFDRDKY